MKIIINSSYGGFRLSALAVKMLSDIKGLGLFPYIWEFRPLTKKALDWKYAIENEERIYFINYGENFEDSDYRTDPDLISIIENLGEKANSRVSKFKIVDIPDDVVDWYITDYDGVETIREGRSWR